VEYKTERQAKAAMKNLAYYKVNFIMPIYLEYAPIGVFEDKRKSENIEMKPE